MEPRGQILHFRGGVSDIFESIFRQIIYTGILTSCQIQNGGRP